MGASASPAVVKVDVSFIPEICISVASPVGADGRHRLGNDPTEHSTKNDEMSKAIDL